VFCVDRGCGFIEEGEKFLSACRDQDNAALVLPPDPQITIMPGILPPKDVDYIFSVSVRKSSRMSPKAASMNVKIVAEAIPLLAIHPTTTYPRNPPEIAAIFKDGALVVNPNQRIIFTASSSANGSRFEWSVSPNVNVSLMPTSESIGPFKGTFIFAAVNADTQLQPGGKYVLELLGVTQDGVSSYSQLALTVNSPPLGGDFKACLLKSLPECVTEGQIQEDFRLAAQGWIDSDVPIMYTFGYTLIPKQKTVLKIAPAGRRLLAPINGSNASNVTVEEDLPVKQTWLEPIREAVLDTEFPAGNVRLMLQVFDSLGATTSVRTFDINVTGEVVIVGPGGRRLLAANDYFAKAKSKLAASLKTSRADKINQMANSVSTHADGGGLGPVDASSMKSSLMASLQSGTGKAIKSTGFACESFGAGKSVTGNAAQLSGGAVSSSAGMLKAMVSGGLGKGGMDMSCASNAASMMGSSLKAQAMFAKQNPNQPSAQPEPMLSAAEAAAFLSSLESGLKEVMRQASWDAVAGEPARVSSTEASEHAMSRTSLNVISGSSVTLAMPALTKLRTIASFALPASFASDVFGTESPEVDIHLQAHGGAPSVGTHVIRSPLVGMTVSRKQAVMETPVTGLSQNFLLRIPIDGSSMPLNARMLLAQQAVCVHWNKTEYSKVGCNITEVTLSSATCSCNHLTMFAISQDKSIPACGDGILQRGEECDDNNIYYSDGCSGRCTVEETWSCEGAPSKCKNYIIPGKEILNNAGVRSTMGLSGYLSKEDFINNKRLFVQSIVASLQVAQVTGQGINSSHVVVIQACYGNDCTTYYSGRRLLALITEVDFQINMPEGANLTLVFKHMSSDSFLRLVETKLSALMNRAIGASYIRAPEEVIKSAGGTSASFGAATGGFRPAENENLGAPADVKIQLTIGVLVGVVLATLCSTALGVYFLYWRGRAKEMDSKIRIKQLVKARLDSLERPDGPSELARMTQVAASSRFKAPEPVDFDSIQELDQASRWSIPPKPITTSSVLDDEAAGVGPFQGLKQGHLPGMVPEIQSLSDKDDFDHTVSRSRLNNTTFGEEFGGVGWSDLAGRPQPQSQSYVPPPPSDDDGSANQRRRFRSPLFPPFLLLCNPGLSVLSFRTYTESPMFDFAGVVATLQKEIRKSQGTAGPIAGATRLYYSRYAPSEPRSVYIFGRSMHGFRDLHCVAAFIAHPARRDICS
jgi:cysteine-rich repeat protein